jgi:hypothetical protein
MASHEIDSSAEKGAKKLFGNDKTNDVRLTATNLRR